MPRSGSHPGAYLYALALIAALFGAMLVTAYRSDVRHTLQFQSDLAHAQLRWAGERLHAPLRKSRTSEVQSIIEAMANQLPTKLIVVRDFSGQILGRHVVADSQQDANHQWLIRLLKKDLDASSQSAFSINIPMHERRVDEESNDKSNASIGNLKLQLLPLIHQSAFITRTQRRVFQTVGLAVVAITGIFLLIYLYRRQSRALAEFADRIANGYPDNSEPSEFVGWNADVARSIAQIKKQGDAKQLGLVEHVSSATENLRADVSRLRTHNAELQTQRKLQEQANHDKAIHIAAISQKLRQPLTTQIGFIDLLERTSLTREQRDYVKTLEKNAAELLKSMNDMLDWARNDPSRLVNGNVGFHLYDLLEELVQKHAEQAYSQNSDIDLWIYSDVPLRVIGNPIWLNQILTELLKNAIKHTHSGRIQIRLAKDRDDRKFAALRFTVSDNGSGLSSEKFEQISRQLSGEAMTDKTSVHKSMGLSISTNLVSLLGGELSMSSLPGEGCSIELTVSLPIQPGRLNQPVVWEGLRGRNCAFIDSTHREEQSPLLHQLENWGVEVTQYENHIKLNGALRQQTTPLYDFVVMAIHPDALEDSYLQSILSFCKTTRIPTITLLCTFSIDIHRRAEALGASRSMPRCVARDQFYHSIHTATQRADTLEFTKPLDGQLVLVADNSRANRLYMVTLIEGLGAKALEAEDGGKAVATFSSRQVDIVLMDLRMPGVDGATATQQIRKQSKGQDCLIIGVSAYVEPQKRQALLDVGMDDVLVKPFDEKTLLQCLESKLRTLEARSSLKKIDNDQATASAEYAVLHSNDLLTQLAEELPTQASAVEDALHSKHYNVARDVVHTLHGTAAFYRLTALRLAARDLETYLLANQGKEADDTIDDLVSAIRHTVERSLSDIHARTNSD